MVTLHERIAIIIDETNNLVAQRYELEQLREQVRKAELRASRQTFASRGLNQLTNRSEESSIGLPGKLKQRPACRPRSFR